MPRKGTSNQGNTNKHESDGTRARTANAGERRTRERGIAWDFEGSAPPDSYDRGNDDDTGRGYDEAAHRGNVYGVPEGLGGAFGTSGGGTYGGGFQVDNRFGSPRGDWTRRTEIDEREGVAPVSAWERGPNRGRGPAGYIRSDERILDDAHDRLERDGWVDATDIELKVTGGEVELRGVVETREMRRRAEEIVDAITGVRHVTNDLRVRRR
ncbi:MAG TPA: BON domain-containing protein [Thermoanaerobaculia bacterium]